VALKTFNPTTPSRRQLVIVDRSELWKGKPVKSLTEGLRGKGGRNNTGRITMRWRGGGNKRRYRIVDFKRSKVEMTMSAPLGDMLTRIRNGQRARQAVVASPASKIRANVLEVLKREGYIRGFTREQTRPGVSELRIELKYVDGEPVIREISRVSKPGRRIYSRIIDLPRSYNGLGISILSTPRGVMSDNEARAAKVGGEVLCRVF